MENTLEFQQVFSKSGLKSIKEEVPIFEAPNYTENYLINCQQETYIKEEVIISDLSDFSENEVSNNEDILQNHNILLKTGKKNNKKLPPKEKINRKQTTEHNECTKCGTKYNNSVSLRRHQRICGLAPFLKCKCCDFKARYSFSLVLHLERMHKHLKAEEIQQIFDRAKKKEYKKLGNTPKSTDHKPVIRNISKPTEWKNFVKLHCTKCDKGFKIITWIDRKCPQCRETTLFQCLKCDKRYTNQCSMRTHLKSTCQPEEYLQCADCDYGSVLKLCLLRHIRRRHITTAPEYCAKCDKHFKRRFNRINHERQCVKKVALLCEFCPFRSRRKDCFEKHVRNHTLYSEKVNADSVDRTTSDAVAIPNCKKIDIIRRSKGGSASNDDKSIKNKMFQCTCGGKYKDKHSLQIHQRRCGLQAYLNCKICGYKTKYGHYLKAHLKKKHDGLKKEEFQNILDTARTKENKILGWCNVVKQYCSKCDVTFEKVNARDRKCLQCCASTFLQCIRCDVRYDSHNSMYNHLRYQCMPKELFHCAECDYRTFIKLRLICHIERVHMPVAPEDYVNCEKCGKGFKLQSYRQMHEKRCGKELNLQCEYCPYKTNIKYSLKRHVKTHLHHPTNAAAIVNASYVDRTIIDGVEVSERTPEPDKATISSDLKPVSKKEKTSKT